MSKPKTTEFQVKAALIQHREKMRQKRYRIEFDTIYNDNLCPICHFRHMVGVVCRKHRGSVCEKHCAECEHFEPNFWHCLYRESEPIDMRKWKPYCTHHDKQELLIFLHENLLYGQLMREAGNASQDNAGKYLTKAKETVAARKSPKFVMADAPDKYGNYSIIDTDTGEVTPLFAVYFEEYKNWTVVEYLPIGA